MESITGRTLLVERECVALLIPHGYEITLIPGSPVRVTQALGDNFTVEIQGNLVMVMGEDRDALGLPALCESDHPLLADNSISLEDKCYYQMRRCYDPEIPVNIVDLGLIYGCETSPIKQEAVDEAVTNQLMDVKISMTLTAPTCGMGPVIIEEVKRKILSLKSVSAVAIDLVFDPPWSQEMMSDAAKLQLGLM